MAEEQAVSMEAFKTLAELVGLSLDEEELARYKAAYDVLRGEAARLRERDLTDLEPAHIFTPDWRWEAGT